LDNPPLKCPGIPKQVVNVGLLKFPELGRGMLADGIDKAVRVEHKKDPLQKALHPTSANTPPPEYTHNNFLRHTGNGIA
jgi:hypothetical protein